jgi:hypothetical protein
MPGVKYAPKGLFSAIFYSDLLEPVNDFFKVGCKIKGILPLARTIIRIISMEIFSRVTRSYDS